MKISGKKEPEWQSENWMERMRSVQDLKEKDKEILRSLAENDPYWRVRMVAAENLDDKDLAQSIYLDIAKHSEDYELEMADLEKSRAEAEKKHHTIIPIFDEDPIVGLRFNTDLLVDVVKNGNYPHARRKAAKMLEDEDALFDIIKTVDDTAIRINALRNLHDQHMLAEVINLIDDDDAREKAVARLCPALRTGFAKNDKSAAVRAVAVSGLYDQALIADIAKNDPDERVRLQAVLVLTDQDALKEIANSEAETDETRRAAAYSLDDEETRRDALYAIDGYDFVFFYNGEDGTIDYERGWIYEGSWEYDYIRHEDFKASPEEWGIIKGGTNYFYDAGWVYFDYQEHVYRNWHNNGQPDRYYTDFYRVRYDGSGLEKLYSDTSEDNYCKIEKVSDGWIHIINDGGTYKLRTDGSVTE